VPNGRLNTAAPFGVSEVTYYRWRGEYGGNMRISHDLKNSEKENTRLRKAISI